MIDIRCQCGKIICQLEQNLVVIKCRHCKRTVNISTKPEDESKIKKYLLVKPKVVNI